MPKKDENVIQMSIMFNQAPKKAMERKMLFNKVKKWISDKEKELRIEKIEIKRNSVILSTKRKFKFLLSFKEGIIFSSVIEDPKENIEDANQIGNKIINYLNTILGERASGVSVNVLHSIMTQKRSLLPRKLIKEEEVAKINELTKRIMNPIGVMFEYELDDRDVSLLIMSMKETSACATASRRSLDDIVPWDFIKNEYKVLNTEEIMNIIMWEV